MMPSLEVVDEYLARSRWGTEDRQEALVRFWRYSETHPASDMTNWRALVRKMAHHAQVDRVRRELVRYRAEVLGISLTEGDDNGTS